MTQTAIAIVEVESNQKTNVIDIKTGFKILHPKYCCGALLNKKTTDLLHIYTCKICNRGIAISR